MSNSVLFLVLPMVGGDCAIMVVIQFLLTKENIRSRGRKSHGLLQKHHFPSGTAAVSLILGWKVEIV